MICLPQKRLRCRLLWCWSWFRELASQQLHYTWARSTNRQPPGTPGCRSPTSTRAAAGSQSWTTRQLTYSMVKEPTARAHKQSFFIFLCYLLMYKWKCDVVTREHNLKLRLCYDKVIEEHVCKQYSLHRQPF